MPDCFKAKYPTATKIKTNTNIAPNPTPPDSFGIVVDVVLVVGGTVVGGSVVGMVVSSVVVVISVVVVELA